MCVCNIHTNLKKHALPHTQTTAHTHRGRHRTTAGPYPRSPCVYVRFHANIEPRLNPRQFTFTYQHNAQLVHFAILPIRYILVFISIDRNKQRTSHSTSCCIAAVFLLQVLLVVCVCVCESFLLYVSNMLLFLRRFFVRLFVRHLRVGVLLFERH